jgi:hypothetical protein
MMKNIQKLIMLSFGMLYVGVCPVATLIVWVWFVIVGFLDKYIDLYC